ncbi:MAG TPA: hypothetical protein VN954_10110 [Ktedonobacteraceae bacterium]|nr:hypothetical protein [Ktedonobacteraceae bacterium]
MDAIIGRYKVRIEDEGIVLTHPSGISFEITSKEALDLQDLLKVYRETLLTSELSSERETNPELERIVIDVREL